MKKDNVRRRPGGSRAHPQDTADFRAGPNALRDLIESRALDLPPKQQRLAKLVLNSPDEVVFGTLRSIAAWSGVSTLTVLRFTKALGFRGYHSFQRATRDAYLRRQDGKRPQGVSQTSAVQATLKQQHDHLADLAGRIRADELDAVCRDIMRAKRVFVCAAAPAWILAEVLWQQLYYAGIPADLVPAVGADAAIGLRNLTTGDVVIGIHLSMIFQALSDVMLQARSKKATTIVFGGTAISPLAKTANHFLHAHAEGKMFHFSLVPMVALMEVVVARLVELNPKPAAGVAQVLLDLALEERLSIAPLSAGPRANRKLKKPG